MVAAAATRRWAGTRRRRAPAPAARRRAPAPRRGRGSRRSGSGSPRTAGGDSSQSRRRKLTLRSPMPCSSSHSMALALASATPRPSSHSLLMAGPSPTYASPSQSSGGWTVRMIGQVVGHGEVPVALVLAGHGHDRPGAVGRQHVVGDVDRHRLAGERVDGAGAGDDAALVERALATTAGRSRLVLRACSTNASTSARRSSVVIVGDQRVLGRQHDVGHAEARVGPGGEHADRRASAPVDAAGRTRRPRSGRSSCAAWS